MVNKDLSFLEKVYILADWLDTADTLLLDYADVIESTPGVSEDLLTLAEWIRDACGGEEMQEDVRAFADRIRNSANGIRIGRSGNVTDVPYDAAIEPFG